MRYIKLNKNWNAEPNAPESSLSKTDDGIKLTFVLNSFMFQHICENCKLLRDWEFWRRPIE
jgi:hypothetical protein